MGFPPLTVCGNRTSPCRPTKTPVVETAGVPRLLNHASFACCWRLSRSMTRSRTVSVCPTQTTRIQPDTVTSRFEWVQWRGLDIAENPHEARPDRGPACASHEADRRVSGPTRCRAGSGSRARPQFLAFVHESIARLDDDVVGEDDAEAIVNSASTRVTDLLVAEVKAQLLVGRMDGVRALLEVAAASDIASRRWSMAFRPLRPLLRTEAAELEPLLPTEDDPRFGDAELYLSRLKTLKTRWASSTRPASSASPRSATKPCSRRARRLRTWRPTRPSIGSSPSTRRP